MGEHLNQVCADPAFQPAYHHLLDMRTVDRCAVTGPNLQAIVTRTPWGPEARCAVVVSADVAYGVGRMYAAFAAQAGHAVQVFRDLPAALHWLGGTGGGNAAGAAGH
jgi:hypothetical protein